MSKRDCRDIRASSRSTQRGTASRPTNRTGLPDRLKAGLEAHSGFAMDDVRVHRNSDKPAQFKALAYARGTDIYLGPGQDRHLPHEAWHVVQQKRGHVRATVQMKGGIGLNENATLERDADVMGSRAAAGAEFVTALPSAVLSSSPVIQRVLTPEEEIERARYKAEIEALGVKPKKIFYEEEPWPYNCHAYTFKVEGNLPISDIDAFLAKWNKRSEVLLCLNGRSVAHSARKHSQGWAQAFDRYPPFVATRSAMSGYRSFNLGNAKELEGVKRLSEEGLKLFNTAKKAMTETIKSAQFAVETNKGIKDESRPIIIADLKNLKENIIRAVYDASGIATLKRLSTETFDDAFRQILTPEFKGSFIVEKYEEIRVSLRNLR